MAQSKVLYMTSTPAGGVKAEIYFMDDNGQPCDEEVATRVEIVEFDSAGEAIFRTYGSTGRNGGGGVKNG